MWFCLILMTVIWFLSFLNPTIYQGVVFIPKTTPQCLKIAKINCFFLVVLFSLFCLDFNVVCRDLLHILEVLLCSDSGIGHIHSAFSEVISYCWTCWLFFCHVAHLNDSWGCCWPLTCVWMMTYHIKRNRDMNHVKM